LFIVFIVGYKLVLYTKDTFFDFDGKGIDRLTGQQLSAFYFCGRKPLKCFHGEF